MNDLIINIAIMTAANCFWLFAIIWESNQRRNEAVASEDQQ